MNCLSNLQANPVTQMIQVDQQVKFAEPLLHSSDFLNDAFKDIFSEGDFKDFYHCSLVDKKWNQLTCDPQVIKKIIFKDFSINPSHWNRFCGIGNASQKEMTKAYTALPKNIGEILKKECSVFTGKKVIDTHMLVFVPETVNNEMVTVNNFGRLLKEQPEFSTNSNGYEYIWDSIAKELGDKPVKSGWVLMIKDLIPTDMFSDFEKEIFGTEEKLIEDLNKKGHTGYRVPKTAEVIACIVAEYLRSKNRLFGDDPQKLVRCEEQIHGNNITFRSCVGAFSSDGLTVTSDFGIAGVGTAAIKEL